MNTYRVLYILLKEKFKELQCVISRQDKALEEHRKALRVKDEVIEQLKRKLKQKIEEKPYK